MRHRVRQPAAAPVAGVDYNLLRAPAPVYGDRGLRLLERLVVGRQRRGAVHLAPRLGHDLVARAGRRRHRLREPPYLQRQYTLTVRATDTFGNDGAAVTRDHVP